MRLNKFLAAGTTLSRRAADAAITAGKVTVNGSTATVGMTVESSDEVKLSGVIVAIPGETETIMFHKPVGYVCSRDGQGSVTIYDILPARYHQLNPVGRLDKNSSGLLLMTNDGQLAEQLTHPRYHKTKIYDVTLSKTLEPLHQQMITDYGVSLDDGVSRFLITAIDSPTARYQITMSEGRNRQIRRTFAALGYNVATLHRTHFGSYTLNNLPSGQTKPI